MDPEECENCRFYHATTAFEGDCRYYPPIIVQSDNYARFPRVCNSWCGKYQIKAI